MKWIYDPDAPDADENGMVPKDSEAPPQSGVFHYWRDLPSYMSPLGTGEITSRSQRREELKRHGCREVEPSEHSGPRYTNPDFIRKHRIPINEGEQ